MNTRCLIFAMAIWIGGQPLGASSFLRMTVDEMMGASEMVFRGKVTSVIPFLDGKSGQIYTRTACSIIETLKGRPGPTVELIHRGGQVGNIGEMNGFAPQFAVGEERLLFVSRRNDGTLYSTHGGATALRLLRGGSGELVPVSQSLLDRVRVHTNPGATPIADISRPATATDSPAMGVPLSRGPLAFTGLLIDANGTPARFPAPDRGEAIPYLVDATSLPAGITLNQALNAVSNALAAWVAVTSLKFTFA